MRLAQSFESLICLPSLNGVNTYAHQHDTVHRAVRQFKGRALLADEVGLGKTIEACLVLKRVLDTGNGPPGARAHAAFAAPSGVAGTNPKASIGNASVWSASTNWHSQSPERQGQRLGEPVPCPLRQSIVFTEFVHTLEYLEQICQRYLRDRTRRAGSLFMF